MSLENKHLGKPGYLAIIDSCLQSIIPFFYKIRFQVTGGSVFQVNQRMKTLLCSRCHADVCQTTSKKCFTVLAAGAARLLYVIQPISPIGASFSRGLPNGEPAAVNLSFSVLKFT